MNRSIETYKKESIVQSLPSVALVNQAKKHFDKFDYDKAEAILLQALDITEQDYLVYKYLGKISEVKLQFSKAIEYYQNCARLNPQDKEVWLRLGLSQLNFGQYEEALQSFEKANTVTPMNTDVYTGWGMTYMKLKDYKKAHDKFIEASNINKYNYTAILLSAVMEVRLKYYDKAEEKLRFLAKVAPNETSLYEYANLRMIKKDYKSSESFALKALEKNKLMLPAYLLLGEVYSIQNNIEKAKEVYQKAIEFGLDCANLHAEFGQSYIRVLDYDNAEIEFKKAQELESENIYAKIGLAYTDAYKNDFSKLNELKETYSTNPYIQEAMGLELFASCQYKEAIEMYNKALASDSSQSICYLNIARAYKLLNNTTKTREYYEKFVAESPIYFAGFIEYCRWLIEIKDFAEAQRKIKRALRIHVDNIELLNMLFYSSYILVKDKNSEYNIKEAVAIANKLRALNVFRYENECIELENRLKSV